MGRTGPCHLAAPGGQVPRKPPLAQSTRLATSPRDPSQASPWSRVDQPVWRVQSACLQNHLSTARCGRTASFYIIQAWLCSRWYNLKEPWKLCFHLLLSLPTSLHPSPHPGSKHMVALYHVGWTSVHGVQRTRPAFPNVPTLSPSPELSRTSPLPPPELSALRCPDGKLRNVRGGTWSPAQWEQIRFIPVIKSHLS